MAKRSVRSHKKSSFNFLSKPFLAGILVVVVIVGLIYFSMVERQVKGVSIFKPPTTSFSNDSASTSATKCNTRIIAFSLSGVCTNNNDRDKFTTATYTCSNGTTGTISKNCFNAQDAFVRANLNCIKASCPVPSFSPRPSIFPLPKQTLPPTTR